MQKFQFCKGDVQKHYSTLRTLMRSRKKTNKMHAKFGMRSRQSQFYSLQGELKFMQPNIYIHADGYTGKIQQSHIMLKEV